MLRLFRRKGWLIVALIIAACLIVWALMRPAGPIEPFYGGKKLSQWMRGHPNEYTPAVRAIGTNALPFLLAEIQATDSAPARYAEKLLAKVSMGPFWQTGRDRAYHAYLALQILDTNAAPALLDMILATPMHMVDGEPALRAATAFAFAFNELPSTNSLQFVEQCLGEALRNPDPMKRRNALMTFSLWPYPSADSFTLIVDLTHDTNALVRAAAMRALIMNRSVTNRTEQTLISRLDDEQAVIRRFAIDGLRLRGTNAIAAIPALQAAYVAEPTRGGLRDTLESGLYNSTAVSSSEIRSAIRDAIRKIDPLAPLPP